MTIRLSSACLIEQKIELIRIEVELRVGQVGFQMLGIRGQLVSQLKQRLFSALRCCGVKLPSTILINLECSKVIKNSSAIDLAIAIGMLVACAKTRINRQDFLVLGKVDINGDVHAFAGLYALVYQAKKLGYKNFIIPQESLESLVLIPDLKYCAVKNLKECLGDKIYFQQCFFKSGVRSLDSAKKDSGQLLNLPSQKLLWRIFKIAAAGGHHLLLFGGVGVGKSLLARQFQSLMPPPNMLELAEIQEISSICEVEYQNSDWSQQTRPFRAPHHRISSAALFGSSRSFGEVTLAHRGVLFLDELLEFSRSQLEGLRIPLDQRKLLISRQGEQYALPANFQLIAATNLCQCGAYSSNSACCTCSKAQIQSYKRKLSQSMLDRIDLQIELKSANICDLHEATICDMSELVLDSEIKKVQEVRFSSFERAGCSNSELAESVLRINCCTPSAERFLEELSRKKAYSVRRFFKLLRVARTIADLDGSSFVEIPQVAEAASYAGLTFSGDY